MNPQPWERAERYRRMMQEDGYRSIRALARATGEDHSPIARVLKVLDLPEGVLAALREHAANAQVRAHFTEKRLRQMVAKRRRETPILPEIQRVIGGCTRHDPVGTHVRWASYSERPAAPGCGQWGALLSW